MPELNPDRLWPLLFFGVPGFIALKTYELFVPGRKASAQILDVLTFGMLNLIVALPILSVTEDLRGTLRGSSYAIATTGLTLVVVVLLPSMMAVAAYKVRMLPAIRRHIQHPFSSAWDFVFQQRREWFLILHLRDGKMVGARFGAKSFASDAFSTGESGPDLFVEETWLLDEDGEFIEKKPASMLIRLSECRGIEFFEVHDLGKEGDEDGEKRRIGRKRRRAELKQ